MDLTEAQMLFLLNEFNISKDKLGSLKRSDLITLREKCFEIEAEEAEAADNNNTDISKRGEAAANVVDIIKAHIKAESASRAAS